MAEDFDPYHRWLGIAPDQRPPDHYQLLGIPRFEADADVIASAADRQMAHVRSFQSGKHGAATQRVLNELAAARVCLLSAEQKARYDARLRSMPSGASGATPNGTAPAPLVGGAAASVVAPGSAGASPVKPASLGRPSSGSADAIPKIAIRAEAKQRRVARLRRPDQFILIGMLAGIVLGVGCTIGVVLLLAPRHGKLVLEMSASDRQLAQLEIDGHPRELPGKGPIEFALSRGTHEVVVKRPAHARFERSVEIVPRSEETVKVQLRPLAKLLIEFTGRRPDNVKLTVDGEPHPVPPGRSFTTPCEPGMHVIRAESARGKFERTVTVLPEQTFRVPVAFLTDHRLVGRWNGTIEIDSAAVERRHAQTRANPLMRALLQPTLDALRAGGSLDLTLRADGTYVFVSKLGPLASASTGRWGVTDEQAARVTVELTPDQGDVEYRQFHFDDKDSFRTELPKELAGLGQFRCRRAP